MVVDQIVKILIDKLNSRNDCLNSIEISQVELNDKRKISPNLNKISIDFVQVNPNY